MPDTTGTFSGRLRGASLYPGMPAALLAGIWYPAGNSEGMKREKRCLEKSAL